MLGRTYRDQSCSVARALEVVGERWTLLIVRDALQGITRYDDFLTGIGVSRNILSVRLNSLVENGILERVRYQERPERFEYVLTPGGRTLAPVIASLMRWGDTFLAGPDRPSRTIEHAGCGGQVRPRMVCDECGEEVSGSQVSVVSRTPAADSR
ncbi:MAG TPA: helix-turn-helix domain-containing protein [Pseudonocardiaceae bacterium]|nr:helix-turn-helix domain-containing protein [Pseudonocardiaceae bacterium]